MDLPISAAIACSDHIDDDRVYLTMNTHQVEALPALALNERSS
jgi:hypothetical protein